MITIKSTAYNYGNDKDIKVEWISRQTRTIEKSQDKDNGLDR